MTIKEFFIPTLINMAFWSVIGWIVGQNAGYKSSINANGIKTQLVKIIVLILLLVFLDSLR